MKKSEINPLPEYFERYINLINDVELSEAFNNSFLELEALDISVLNQLENKVYAPGKWTVKTIIQHITDFERIFCYRALMFAREDKNIRQGADENMLAVTARADARPTEDLVAELKTVRQASKFLFDSFDKQMLMQTNISWKYEISVLALGFTIIGHQIHHFQIIKDRYYPLIK